MALSSEGLVAKLNATCRAGLEEAAELSLVRTHYEVDIEHYLLKLSEMSDADVSAIYRYFEIDSSQVSRDLTRALDCMKWGNSRRPAISPRIVRWLSEAWSLASVEYRASQIRSSFILAALLTSDSLSHFATDTCPELKRISIDSLRGGLLSICESTVEDVAGFTKKSRTEAREGRQLPSGAPPSAQSNLDQFTIDLTEAARAGKIDPVLGRDFEIRQIVDILTRRRQNNPILTGEAGVGKTAVVEGFARRVASGDLPPSLRSVQVRTLDLGLLQAGAGVRGEFENRLKNVIAEVKSSATPIILFIDEAHTMIGAGGQAGQNDAANLLKPALARGELRTIAATTWSEYKKYFEKDAALARRFQVIKVEEPTEEQCDGMLRGVKSTLEKHHRVTVLDEAVTTAVRLSQRYISGRQLPDKAVSVLDTACARVALAQNATPASLEDGQRRIEMVEIELGILERESATGTDHGERLAKLKAERESSQAHVAELHAQVTQERAVIQKMIELRARIEENVLPDAPPVPAMATLTGTCPVLVVPQATAKTSAAELGGMRIELSNLAAGLATLQGENPLVRPYVDGGTIAEVIAGWTGIPVGKMLKDEIETILKLKDLLAQRVVGQDYALQAISQRIQTARAGLDDPRRPIGVFLLVGPSGVGKTETALALADTLYGGERNLVTINMSEYQEAHSISGLKGSPPGYVGFGEGGILTEAVRRKPYCVLLLDEMEKAHLDVRELFYQVFDKGFMEDAEGREVDFKNTVILMTSNTGSDRIMKLCADPAMCPEPAALGEELGPELRHVFKPAFLGRLIVVPYYPIGDESLRKITRLKLEQIGLRMQESHHVPFTYSEELVSEIVGRCTEVESGARNVDHILTGTILPEISTEMLSRMISGSALSRVHVTADAGKGFQYAIE